MVYAAVGGAMWGAAAVGGATWGAAAVGGAMWGAAFLCVSCVKYVLYKLCIWAVTVGRVSLWNSTFLSIPLPFQRSMGNSSPDGV